MQQQRQPHRVQVETVPHQQISLNELENCVLANVEGTDNGMRNKAERYLKELQNNQPIEYISGLCQLLAQSKNNNVRACCAVLLRQSMGILDFTFDKVPKNIENDLKKLLLNLTQNETDRTVLLQVTQLLGALACKTLHSGGWSELFEFTEHLSKSEIARHREAFLIILEQLCEFAIDILRPKIKNIKLMLVNSLQDRSEQVRIAAIKSTVKLLLSLEETNELPQFKDVVPLLFQNISIANKTICENKNNSNNKNELLNDVICHACSELHGLTTNIPDFFSDAMKPIVQCLAEVVNSSHLEWETRRMAMDLLRTLIEHNIDAFEENDSDLSNLANKVIPLCFLFVQEVDETSLQDWNSPSDLDDQINFIFGCEMLQRISQVLDAQLFWDLCYNNVLIKGFQANSHWKDRLTALATIEKCIEACGDLFITDTNGANTNTNTNNTNNGNEGSNNETDDKSEEIYDDSIDKDKLNPIVQATGQSLSHGNAFVRYEALLVIKQLSIVFGNYGFQMEYHNCIMNALNEMIAGKMSQNEHRCVKIQVCDTLAHFCYEFEPQIMRAYADTTLQGLYKLLQSNDVLIQCDAFKAVSVLTQSIAECDESRFGKYYDTFMQLCTDILTKTLTNCDKSLLSDPKYALLRGKAMECIGNMFISMCCPIDGSWIKNDKCIEDAHKLMKVLLPFLSKEREIGLESYSFMNSLFASIAISIRSEFKPYLKNTINPLIEACKLEPVRIEAIAPSGLNVGAAGTVTSTNTNNENNENNINAMNSNVILAQTFHVHGEMTDRKVELHTSEAMEQFSAVKELLRYSECMGNDLFEFVEPICNGLLEIMRRKGNSEMRKNAVKTMPYLVEIMKNGLKLRNMQLVPVMVEMINSVIHGVISAMVIEEDVYGLTEITESLIEILEFIDCSNGIIPSEEVVTEIVEQIGNAVQERILRRSNGGFDDTSESNEASASPIAINNNNNNNNNIGPAGASTLSTTSTDGTNTVSTGNPSGCGSTSEVNEKGVEQAEADLGNKICDLVSKMSQLFGSNFVKLFDEVSYQVCTELFLKKTTNESDWIFGLSIFGEIIQYGGKLGSKYVKEILNKCSEFLSNNKAMNTLPDSNGLKQSIGYTVGICALQRKYHNSLNPQWWTNKIKTIIIDNIDNGISINNGNYELARDNAVSAIGKILDSYWNDFVVIKNPNNNNNNNMLNFEMIGAWIDMLPIKEDEEERQWCNKFLLRILQSRNCPNDKNNDMLLDVLINKFGTKLVNKFIEIIAVSIVNEDDASEEFKAMLAHVKTKCGDNVVKQCVQLLPMELRTVFV